MKCYRNMTRVPCKAFLVIVEFLGILAFSRGDSEVSCVFMKRCILPCSLQGRSEIVIHWIKTAENLRVHSYYSNQDQLGLQDQRFRNRTSLFKDQISKGNASLQLTAVTVQDEGRYKCHTSTISGNKDSFISLSIDAPVHKVVLLQERLRIICSSEGIYPKPELTWTTSPPSNMTLQKKSTVQQNEQLYSINSSLILPDTDDHPDYICTVSTGRNRRRATFRQQALIIGSYSETTIPCSTLNTSVMSLSWRFNNSQTILTKTETDSQYRVSEEWKQHVKDISESGSLTLQDISSAQEGIYTCELSDGEERMVTNIFVRTSQASSANFGGIVGGVVGFIVVIAAVAACLILYKKKKKG